MDIRSLHEKSFSCVTIFNTMVVLLVLVIGLVGWSLHLMQQAINHREFSLMLAGTLVAASAAATMVVYFLMQSCMGHIMNAAQYSS